MEQFEKAEWLSLKEHPELNEKWVQELITMEQNRRGFLQVAGVAAANFHVGWSAVRSMGRERGDWKNEDRECRFDEPRRYGAGRSDANQSEGLERLHGAGAPQRAHPCARARGGIDRCRYGCATRCRMRCRALDPESGRRT